MNIKFRKKWALLIAAVAIALLSRIPFLPENINFNNDAPIYSANIQRPFLSGYYDVQMPGYILYIYSGKLVNSLFADPVKSQHALNIFLIILVTITFFNLLNKIGFSIYDSFIYTIIFLSNSVLLIGSITGGNRIILSLASILLINTAISALTENKTIYVIWHGVILAILSGYRQDLLFNFIPLFLYLMWHSKSIKTTFISIFLFSTICILWAMPLMAEYGGMNNYIEKTINSKAVTHTSIIMNGLSASPILNILRVLIYIINSVLLLLPIYFYSHKENIFKTNNFLFKVLCIAFVPAFMFHDSCSQWQLCTPNSFYSPIIYFNSLWV